MKKLLLSLPVVAVLMTATPAYAQIRIRDPFNSFFDAMMLAPQPFEPPAFAGPKMDVADLKDKIEVKVELPGMDEKDIELSMDDGVLTISGEKKTETQSDDKGYSLKECSYGSFSRSIRLPENIADDKIAAKFDKGVLMVDVPKKEPTTAKSRKIAITH